VKAVILAGGKGTRGKPYTEYFPKAMTPINEKPLIEYIVRYLNSFHFIEEIIIISNFNGIGGQIKNYFQNPKLNKKISFVQDSQSGTAGDLLPLEKKIGKDAGFILWFVDNLCALDLKKMYKYYTEKQSAACIATRKKRKEETGFAIVEKGLVKQFKEKPTIKLPMSECLGIYILGKQVINRIKLKNKQKEINLSYDILQELSTEGKISAYDIGDLQWIDVESPMTLERNQKEVKKIIKQMGF